MIPKFDCAVAEQLTSVTLCNSNATKNALAGGFNQISSFRFE
jgi:hypothetical protein